MITVFIAILMTCTSASKDDAIKCTWGASEETWETKKECEVKAPKLYKMDVRCIDIDVKIKDESAKEIKIVPLKDEDIPSLVMR